jgi:ribonucleotide monophosphatase NagD (HAD superfamily)
VSDPAILAETADLFGTPYAAARCLWAQTYTRACVLVRRDAPSEFQAITDTGRNADAIVGNLGDAWSFLGLNQGFRLLTEGGRANCLAADGPRLDAGPFLMALEFAVGEEALVLGKPPSTFLKLTLDDLGLHPEQVAMVRADIEVDAAVEQRARMVGIVVHTGKCTLGSSDRTI